MFYTRSLMCTLVFRNTGTPQENGQKFPTKFVHNIIVFSLENVCGRNIDTQKRYNIFTLYMF